jgi:DNA adenine methylase
LIKPKAIVYVYNMETKPFLKWAGGKTQILPDVMNLFPQEMNHYHEPFLGGGSVLLALLDAQTKGKIRIKGTLYASDVNPHLIALYQCIQTEPEALIQEVMRLVAEYESCQGTEIQRNPTQEQAFTSPESYYFWIRKQFNLQNKNLLQSSIESCAKMLFLNKTCFRGLYREGPNGFNVPFGNYKHPKVLDEDHIRKVSRMIQPVVFRTCSFEEALQQVGPQDFVYLDPPYAPEHESSFTHYTHKGFPLEQHQTLFQLCKQLKSGWVLSNADVTLVREAFLSYPQQTISCRRSIHSKTPDARTNERLIHSLSLSMLKM